MLGGNFPQRDNSRNPQDSVKGQGAGPAAHAGEASTSDAQLVLVSNRDPFDWREEGVPWRYRGRPHRPAGAVAADARLL
jgi:hypothetical protein